MEDKLLSYAELGDVLGVPYSRQHLRRLEAKGEFPARVKVGDRKVAWSMQEVRQWMEERKKVRETV